MVKRNNIDHIFNALIQTPYTAKVYRDLANYFESLNMENESNAFKELLKNKFKDDINSDTNRE